jgi:DNA-binding NarL/FixJ family response regulator
MTEIPTIGVFLVDDHRAMLWGLQRLIDGMKPRMEVVGSATTLEAALEQVAECKPHVVLLDLDVAGQSGLDIVAPLIERCAARVLVLTGVRDPTIHDRAVLVGACGVVTKESSSETILKAIEKAAAGELWLDRAATGRMFMELSRRHASVPSDPLEPLTPREREIVKQMATDAAATTREIAARLGITERTLRNHLSSIYEKIGVSTRVELWAFANRNNVGGKPG